MKTDFLVIGSGIAGLSVSLELAKYGDVIIATKRKAEESNTLHAQGGIATVLSKDDSFELHVSDTLTAGAGLCNREIVELCVRSGPERIEWLIEQGVVFTKMSKDATLEFDLGREGGHSRRRVLHVQDLTGREVEKVLLARVRECPNIEVIENLMALDLAVEDNKVVGAWFITRDTFEVRTICAKATILATGGSGKVYLYTSNPDVATGDGLAIAYRAGARVANLEFFQFHPTCLYHPHAKSFLISEALRGEGGRLRRLDGEAFMGAYHPMKDLAPRDIVARAIDTEMKRTGDDHVLLDMTHLNPDFLVTRFPNIHETCLKYGIDMRFQPIPVVPAAHYQCGGVLVDKNGRTNLPNLYAIGEVSCTGLHGANRLASNSLLEALVFAHRVAEDLGQRKNSLPNTVPDEPEPLSWLKNTQVKSNPESVMVSQNWDEVRRLMWNYVSIVRSNRRLLAARRRLDLIAQEVKEYMLSFPLTPDLAELRNIVTVAYLIVESALYRQESRGLHYNVNYPDTDDERFARDTILWAGTNNILL